MTAQQRRGLALFDQPPFTAMELSIFKAGRNATPHRPGTGPAGESCKTCRHLSPVEYHNKHYLKCGLMRALWSHGPGTDIRAKWPACRAWEATTKED